MLLVDQERGLVVNQKDVLEEVQHDVLRYWLIKSVLLVDQKGVLPSGDQQAALIVCLCEANNTASGGGSMSGLY